MTPLARIQHQAGYGRGKRNRNMRHWLLAFERAVEQADRNTATVRHAMAVAPGHRFSDPRYAAGTSVNATDTRASKPWRQSSGHGAEPVTVITGLPLWVTAALDTDTIARLWPAHVSVLAPQSGSERQSSGKRQSRQASPSEARRAALRRAAGTIRMGEQD